MLCTALCYLEKIIKFHVFWILSLLVAGDVESNPGPNPHMVSHASSVELKDAMGMLHIIINIYVALDLAR